MQEHKDNAALPFELLPIEIVFNIFNHLPITELIKLAVLNKYFLLISNSEKYWREKLRIHFPHYHSNDKTRAIKNWKKEYQLKASSEYQYYDKTEWEVFNRVKEGELELLKQLSATYPLNTYKDINNYNLLHWAAHKGYLQTVRYLLTHHDFNVNDTILNNSSFTAAELALHNNHIDIVNFLAEKGSKINFAKPENLIITLQNNHFKAVNYLIENQTINFEAILLEDFFRLLGLVNSYEISSLLFSKWSKYHSANDCKSLLHMAMLNEHCDLTHIILISNSSLAIDKKTIPKILVTAANYNKKNLIMLIARKFPETINLDKLLFLSASAGHAELVEYFIQQGANCNSPSFKTFPLSIACANNHLEVVKVLVANHAYIDQYNENAPNTGLVIFELNIQKEKYDICEYLATKEGDINLVDANGKTTSLILAIHNGHYEIAEYLIKNGANVNLSDGNGCTPLSYAARKEYGDSMIDFLLSHHADLYLADKEGYTPLHYAVLFARDEIVELLLTHNARLVADKGGVRPFYRLIERIIAICNYRDFEPKKYFPILELFFRSGLLHQKDANLNTPLHLFCRKMSPNLMPLINFFIDHGVDLDAINNAGKAAIHYAARYNPIFFEALLNRGANIRLRTPCGKTVLHIASRHLHTSLIDLILKNGIDINVTNNVGATPIHYAAKSNHLNNFKVIEYLITKGAYITQLTHLGDNVLHVGFGKIMPYFSKWYDPYIDLLCAKININDANKKGVTPILLAAQRGNLDAVLVAITKGANKQAIDLSGNTILHFFANRQSTDDRLAILNLLLGDNKTININHQNWEGATVLHYEARRKDVDMYVWNLLIAKGAKTNLKDKHNKTPIDYLAANHLHFKAFLPSLIYDCPDIDLFKLENIINLSGRDLLKAQIRQAVESHKFFQQAIQLIEQPPLLFSFSIFSSSNSPEKMLTQKFNQLVELSQKSDNRYFEKNLFLYLTHNTRLTDKFLNYLLNSPAVLQSNNPKILLLLATFAKENKFLHLPNESIREFYTQAAELFEAVGETEFASYAQEQANKFDHYNLIDIAFTQ